MFSLAGKIAVVTGGASGIGRAIAERLEAAGAIVVVGDIADPTGGWGAGSRYVQTDVSEESQVKRLMDTAAELNGHIDVCVNNAGIIEEASIEETTPSMVERSFRVNAMGVFLGMKHASGHMRRGGSLINTASIGALIAFPTYTAYCASKAAVVAMTKVAALEFGPRGIRVNCICPTSVDTPMLASQAAPEVETAITVRSSPLGRILRPQEVAALVHFLAADDCPMISGQALVIDGGTMAGFSEALIEAAVGASGLA